MNQTLQVTMLLREVGVPLNVIGYNMLRDAIEMVLEDDSLQWALTTRLYPQVAKRFETTGSRAERNMRHAVERASTRGTHELVRLFGWEKPTLGQFIATLADELRVFRLVAVES